MEYKQSYDVEKEIHLMDCLNLVDIAAGCSRQYRGKGVKIKLKGDFHGEVKTGEVLSLLSGCDKFKPTSKIEVIVSGELPK